jgi:hypothetical protein
MISASVSGDLAADDPRELVEGCSNVARGV